RGNDDGDSDPRRTPASWPTRPPRGQRNPGGSTSRLPVTPAPILAPRSGGWVAFEGIRGDPPGEVLADRCGGGAARLAPRLVLEARQELRAESQPWIAGEDLRPAGRGGVLGPA